MVSSWILRVLVLGVLILPSIGVAAEGDKINLRLFGKSVIGNYQGCFFALWQRNKDPEKNKFSYVFFVRFHDAQPMPALIKIDKKYLELDKVEMGLKDSGLSDKFQLYRDFDKTTTLLVEIIDEIRSGDETNVSKAKLTFIQKNKFPFVMNVKGGFRCPKHQNENAAVEEKRSSVDAGNSRMSPQNLDPNGVRLSKGVEFDSLSSVPRSVLAVVRGNSESCNLDNVPGYGLRYAISNAMTLWQVPCDLFASNSSVMLVAALNGTRHAVGLEIPKRPGKRGAPGYDMLWPKIDHKSGVVTVTSMGNRGDCGTLEHYQLIFAEGESVELKLLEVREKNDCDGISIKPKNLPLVYRAQ